MKQNKNIYLVVDQGFSARYLLRSDFFKVLRHSGNRIIILTPNSDEAYMKNEFTDENVLLHHYELEKYAKFIKRSSLHRLIRSAFLFVYENHTEVNHPAFWYPHYLSAMKDGSIKRYILGCLFDAWVKMLRVSGRFRKFIQYVGSFFSPQYHNSVFEAYPPNLLITSSLGNLSFDYFIMNEAKMHGAKIISMILSWDNPTTKGFSRIQPDYVIAWTETMKKELMRFHGIRSEKIFVGGVVQYDPYFSSNSLMSKTELFKHFGLAEDRKLIFLCLMSPAQFPWNPKLVSLLGELIQQSAFSEPCQILVRLHPIYFRVNNGKNVFQKDIDELKHIQNKYPYVYYDIPEILSQKMSYDMPFFEAVKLGSTLRYSDILLCFFSSMMIEASIFDTPVVNVALVDKNEIPMEVILKHNHVRRILETGGVKTAFTHQDFINYINQYLKNPHIDSEGRKQIVNQEIGPYPGQAGKIIGQKLLEILEE
jgi:hypothetical protein